MLWYKWYEPWTQFFACFSQKLAPARKNSTDWSAQSARFCNSAQLLLFSVSAWLPNCTICVSVIKGGWLDSGKSSWKEEKNIFLSGYGLSLNTFFIASMTLRHASVRSVSWQNRLPVSAKLLLLPWPDSCEVEVCLCRDGRPMGFQCKFAATIIHNGELCALWNELWWHVILKDTKY